MSFPDVIPDGTLIMPIGLPAAGKSTFLKELQDLHGDRIVVVSFDAVVEAMAAERGVPYNDMIKLIDESRSEAGQRYDALVEKAKAHQGIVYWDQTNLTQPERSKKQELFPEFKKIGVFFDISEEESQRRCAKRYEETGKFIPPEVITRMAGWLKDGFPKPDEFDAMYHVRPSEKMVPYQWPVGGPSDEAIANVPVRKPPKP